MRSNTPPHPLAAMKKHNVFPLRTVFASLLLVSSSLIVDTWAWSSSNSPSRISDQSRRTTRDDTPNTGAVTLWAAAATTPWFNSGSGSSGISTEAIVTLEQRKATLLQLGASLDRGQAYNPTSGEYYKDRMDVAVQKIDEFVAATAAIPTSLEDIAGEWELVLTTVPHGIFRSSPFFLAIQEAYETYAQVKDSLGVPKALLFFKLHELQTCSWGVSKIGRVAQHITVDSNNNNNNNGYLYSEFDTSIFSLTVIPIIGWFKLLPTFGGCVVTAASCQLGDEGELRMKVDYTTARPVPGLNGLGDWIWNVKVPVGKIWKLLPWNQGRDAECRIFIRYWDADFRIVQDVSGDYFVYTRPVVPRALDLAEPSARQ